MKEKILVLAKTYPNLSRKYVETVCVAGITDKGEWRRLYPVPFRRLPKEKQFKKFHWIEAETHRDEKERFVKRKESYKVELASIQVIEHLGTGKKRDWAERNSLLLPLRSGSLEELEEAKKSGVSLGIVKPKELISFTRTPLSECREWERELMEGAQQTLSGVYKTPLAKIPWKFSYTFRCNNPECKGHTLMCEDWELLESWRKWQKLYRTDKARWEKLQERYFEWMKKRDLHLIIGTEWRFNKFLIIGLYYPPKG